MEQLLELQMLLEGEVVTSQVVDLLYELGMHLLDGSPEIRQEIVGLDGYQTIVQAWAGFCDTGETQIRVLWKDTELIREASLFALAALTYDQTEIMDEKGYAMIVQALDFGVSELTQIYGLNVMRNICYGSEDNRENLTSTYKIIGPFAHLIKRDAPGPELLQTWSETLRAFTLYDDPNDGYTRSVQRRQMIFLCGGINYLVNFMTEFKDDYDTINSILSAIGILSKTGLHCAEMERAGVLVGLDSLFPIYADDIYLLTQIIGCLKNLSSSAEVCEKISGTGIIKNIVGAFWEHNDNSDFVEIAVSTLAYMTRKTRCTVTQAMTTRAILFVLNFLYCYNDNVNILKGCCLLLQNLAFYGGSIGRKEILDNGAEALLRGIMDKYEDLAEYHVKPALKNLGFEIEFNTNGSAEEVHGAGAALVAEENKT